MVEIQDAATGAPLPGYAIGEAVPLVANAVAARPTWANGFNIQHLAGKDIRLRFVLQDAKLYTAFSSS